MKDIKTAQELREELALETARLAGLKTRYTALQAEIKQVTQDIAELTGSW